MDRLYGVAERLILVVVDGWRREVDRGAAARPPTACWEKELESGTELEGGTEGQNTLFSPLNPSGTCHTLVMDVKRKTVKKRKGRKWKKRTEGLLDFFL